MSHFSRFTKIVHSQNGEDGIIAELIRELKLSPTDGTFVEFGMLDGKQYSNTLALAEKGWRGVWIEAEVDYYEKMKEFAKTFDDRVQCFCHRVGFEANDNLDTLLSVTSMPLSIDVMSIDIDSYDLEVWKACNEYRPKILLIEINSSIEPGVRQTHSATTEGASFTSMMEVAEEKGYRLVCHTGNLIFVANEWASRLTMPQAEIDNPVSIFNPQWVYWAKKAAAAAEVAK